MASLQRGSPVLLPNTAFVAAKAREIQCAAELERYGCAQSGVAQRYPVRRVQLLYFLAGPSLGAVAKHSFSSLVGKQRAGCAQRTCCRGIAKARISSAVRRICCSRPISSRLPFSKKIRVERIFIAPNAVDNDLFSSLAALARRDANANRRKLGFPDRYVLFVGRLVSEKGILISCAPMLDWKTVRRERGLVFVGDGPVRQELQERASEISVVRSDWQVLLIANNFQVTMPSLKCWSSRHILTLGG